MEHQGPQDQTHIDDELGRLLAHAQAKGLLTEAIMAHTVAQRQAMWQLRESIPLAEKTEGLMVKHDIGLPTSHIPGFIAQVEAALHQRWPTSAVVSSTTMLIATEIRAKRIGALVSWRAKKTGDSTRPRMKAGVPQP